jgi:phosphoribosylamine--glycine ligase
VFHAGTSAEGNKIVVTGGRVLCVTALGHNVRTAQKRAYEIVSRIRYDGMQYRRDIGHRALAPRVASRPPDPAAGPPPSAAPATDK